MGLILAIIEWFLAWYRIVYMIHGMAMSLLTLVIYNLRPQPCSSVFTKIVKRYPSKTCLIDAVTGKKMTFTEVDRLANRVASWARAEGIVTGKVVALLMENRPEYFAFWLGVMKTGGATALLNTNTRGESLAHAISISDASIVVVGPELVATFLEMQKESNALKLLPKELKVYLYCADSSVPIPPKGWKSLDDILPTCSLEEPLPLKNFTARTCALLIYTSGTTGMPKAAKITHMRLRQLLETGTVMGVTSSDIAYCALPLYHSAGGCMTVGYMMCKGATLVVRKKFTARGFWLDCYKFDVTVIQYIGELCRYLVNTEPSEFDQKHHVRLAIGNGLRPDVWEEFKKRFKVKRIAEFYGSTEGNVACFNPFGEQHAIGYLPLFPWPFTYFSPTRCRLFPIQFVRYDRETEAPYRGLDGHCVVADLGEVAEPIGEISSGRDITGLKAFEGYVDKASTDKKILKDVFKAGDLYFRTGDLLRIDKRGFIYFVDRVGDTFRWKGENVSTMQVAEACTKISGVSEANVYGVSIPKTDGRAGMAALTMKGDEKLDVLEAFRVLTAELPPFAVPVFLRVLKEMEITGTFKHRKPELQREGYEAMTDPLFVLNIKGKTYDVLTPYMVKQINSFEIRL